MTSITTFVFDNQPRIGESPQGYALRLLKKARSLWVSEIYDGSRKCAEEEGKKRAAGSDAEDACSNIAIAITQAKKSEIALINL